MSKKQPKLTPWFPAHVEPVRNGFYQRRYSTKEFIEACDYWDGEWILYGIDGERIGLSCEPRQWRGLAVKP